MKVLVDLMNAYGVSGNEKEIRKVIRKHIKPYVDKITVDKMGNLICQKTGKGAKIMLAAHMDEIGMMVKRIDKHGFIYVSPIGGMDPIPLIGGRVHIPTKKCLIHGVITTKAISSGEDLAELPTIDDMIIDTGLSKAELNKMSVQVGTYIYFESQPNILKYGKKITGKAVDDRIGCYMLIELAKMLKNAKTHIYFVFTVQEEFGLYGAAASAFTIEPDWGVAIDVTVADDLYAEEGTEKLYLGKGPVLTVKDDRLIANTCINNVIKKIAKKLKINLQYEISEFGTTDAASIATSRGGVPSTVFSIPIRNVHTTMGIAHMDDIKAALRVLRELLKKSPKICFGPPN